MSVFGKLTNDGLEETKDVLGGFVTYDTDIYLAKIKAAFAGKSDGGAQNVTLLLTLPGGKEYRETVYITNKKGENWFLNKNDTKKKVPLPGFTTIDDICLMTTDKPLAQQDTEDKVMKVYDPQEKKELPKSVPVLTGLTDKEIFIAIEKSLVNKNEKDNSGNYVATAEEREENNIVKVFHSPSKITVPEAREAQKTGNAPTPAFHDAWLEKNKGKVRDKRTIKNGVGGGSTNGRPPQSGAAAGGEKKTTSLFGK